MKMVQNGRISDFHGLLTLTLDPGMVITIFHLSSSTTCIRNFIEIEETFCGRTDGRNLPPIVLGRLPKFGSRPNNTRSRLFPKLSQIERFAVYLWYSYHMSVCGDQFCSVL